MDREGDGSEGRYRNTPSSAQFLDKNSPAYIGGILEMWENRSYQFWGDLGEALKTGKPQNEIKHNQRSIFEVLYEDPAKLEQFVNAMAGISFENGALVAIENLIDDARRENLFGLLIMG